MKNFHIVLKSIVSLIRVFVSSQIFKRIKIHNLPHLCGINSLNFEVFNLYPPDLHTYFAMHRTSSVVLKTLLPFLKFCWYKVHQVFYFSWLNPPPTSIFLRGVHCYQTSRRSIVFEVNLIIVVFLCIKLSFFLNP